MGRKRHHWNRLFCFITIILPNIWRVYTKKYFATNTVEKKEYKNICDLKRGCVIFWKGHVGIMVDNLNCIHANAFHMKTKTEPLSQTIERIGEDLNKIKMMDFN